MSNDYISRADAKRLIADIQLGETPKDAPRTVYLSGVHEGLNMAYGAIASMRPADVRPVVRGEWIETGYFDQYYQPIYECSHCHGEVADSFMAKHLFCLHCGADMRPAPEPPKREEGADG